MISIPETDTTVYLSANKTGLSQYSPILVRHN